MMVVASTIAPHAGAEPHKPGVLLAQADRAQGPYLTVRPTVVATPADQTPLAIRIVPSAAAANSFLRLKGLPPAAFLSAGHAIAPGSWAIPINVLPNLTVTLPASAVGRMELTVNLVSEDGRLLDEARLTLVIEPSSAANRETSPSPSPPDAPPPVSTAERAAAEKLVARGDRDLQNGNIVQARQFYQRAAQLGFASGALKLGATYDPRELARLQTIGIVPNVAEARKWYARALELGAQEAKERLAALGGGG
jgi:hypothetical protein